MYLLQPSFSGGEFSPSLHSRIDIQKYSTGLRLLKNFIIHAHGGTSNRGGLEFVAEGDKVFGDPGHPIRLIPFEFSVDQSYALEFGHHYIRVIKDGGLVDNGMGAPVKIVTTYSEEEIFELKYIQSVDVLYLFHPSHPPRMLTRYAENIWDLSDFPFEEGPFMLEKFTKPLLITLNSAPTSTFFEKDSLININTYIDEIFTLGHVGALLKFEQYTEGRSFTATLASNVQAGSDLLVKGTWRLGTRGTWGGAIQIMRRELKAGAAWEAIKTFSHNSGDYNLDVSGVEDELCQMTIKMINYGGGTCSADFSVDSYKLDGIAKITARIDNHNVTAKVMKPFGSTIVASPYKLISWQEGSWSIKRGFPSCGAFHQDRLCAGATPSEPQTVWASKTGNYVNFGTSSPLLDTDAVGVNIPSRKMNGIKNMIALNEILAFTSASEAGVGSDGVFTPTTVKTRTYGYRGSSSVAPVVIGNRAIIVQAMGSVVRDFGYDYSADGYTGGDLSIFSSHLFKDKAIREMAYQQEPDSLVWCVRSDGIALSLTYVKEQDVIGWSWHETQGKFESVCSIPGNGQNDVYFVVKRGDKRYIERLGRRLPSTDVKESFFLDSALTYKGAPTSQISGLNHLEGMTVNALADGRVIKGLVVEDGKIHLDHEASVVTVGLGYESVLKTLKVQAQTQDGPSLGRLVKISEVIFSFLNSRSGKIGPSDLDEEMDPIDSLIPDGELDTPYPLYTGDYSQPLAGAGYSSDGTVCFKQDDPLPVTILSINPKITFGG